MHVRNKPTKAIVYFNVEKTSVHRVMKARDNGKKNARSVQNCALIKPFCQNRAHIVSTNISRFAAKTYLKVLSILLLIVRPEH